MSLFRWWASRQKSSKSPARKKNSGPTTRAKVQSFFISRAAFCDVLVPVPIDRLRFLAGSQLRYTPSCSTPRNMSLPQPRNVLPLEGQIDLNVSAKVTEPINELIKDTPADLVVDLA